MYHMHCVTFTLLPPGSLPDDNSVCDSRWLRYCVCTECNSLQTTRSVVQESLFLADHGYWSNWLNVIEQDKSVYS